MLSKKIKIISSLAIPALIIAGVCVWRINKQTAIINSYVREEQAPPEVVIPVKYNWALFYTAIDRYPDQAIDADNKVIGAIVPHHDLAADYTAELFQKIGRREIKTVIIVGPNHENSGAGEIITGLVAYSTPFGQIHSNGNLISKILKEKIAVSDPDRLTSEHAIYNIAPYVGYYFPGAQIVPIILSGRVTRKQAEALGQYLAGQLDEKTLVIGSIDFSHYLATEQARSNDLITREALRTRNYQKIYSFNNDYVDSPPTAVTVLAAAEKAGAPVVGIIRNTNQADATGVSSVLSSTSYFTVLLKR